MIRILARHPATARHIALQLCQRLVADDPPAALVDRVAKRFLATDGDLRQTVRAVVESPEFFDPRYYRAKVKSPFEYVVSGDPARRRRDGRAAPAPQARSRRWASRSTSASRRPATPTPRRRGSTRARSSRG